MGNKIFQNGPRDVNRSTGSCVKKPLPGAALLSEAAGCSSEEKSSGAPAAPAGQETIRCTKSLPPAHGRRQKRLRSLKETRQLYLIQLRTTSEGKICQFIQTQTGCCMLIVYRDTE